MGFMGGTWMRIDGKPVSGGYYHHIRRYYIHR